MVVDSSVWIEILSDGPLKQMCLKAMTGKHLRVPSLVIFEVYRKIKAKASEEAALEVVAHLNSHDVLDLTKEVALLAGDLSLQHKIAMADSVVLAHAELLSDRLLTLDNDFSSLESAVVIRK